VTLNDEMSSFGMDARMETLRHLLSSRRWWIEAVSEEGLAWLGTKCHQWRNGRVAQTSLGLCSCQRMAFWAFSM